MLHTKFCGNQMTGFRKDFLTVWVHYGQVTHMPQTCFCSPTHRGSTQNLASIGQAVYEKMFENVEGRRTDAGAWAYFKLIYEPLGQVS